MSWKRTAAVVAVIGVVLALLYLGYRAIFGYWNAEVKGHENAMLFKNGVPVQVVGPGYYSDTTLFADIKTFRVDNQYVCYTNSEVALQGLQQLVGITTCANVRNPAMNAFNYVQNWDVCSSYFLDIDKVTGISNESNVVSNDSPVAGVLGQAQKVCAGSRTLEEASVGQSRNDLADCIKELASKTMEAEYCGIIIDGLTVPDIQVPDTVRASIQSVGLSKSNTQLLEQQELEEKAKSDREKAIQVGIINVEQGKLQAEADQKKETTLRQIEAEKALGDLIQAQIDNSLAREEGQLRLAEIQRVVADQRALADTAKERAIAMIYEAYPEYAEYLGAVAAYKAFAETDSVYVGEGFDPRLWFQLPSVVPE